MRTGHEPLIKLLRSGHATRLVKACYSAAGFAADLRALAGADDRVALIGIEDIYS